MSAFKRRRCDNNKIAFVFSPEFNDSHNNHTFRRKNRVPQQTSKSEINQRELKQLISEMTKIQSILHKMMKTQQILSDKIDVLNEQMTKVENQLDNGMDCENEEEAYNYKPNSKPDSNPNQGQYCSYII